MELLWIYVDLLVWRLVQKQRNSSADALELRLFCTNLWKC